MGRPAQGVGIQVVANRVEEGGRAAEHVAFDVAAGRQGRQQGFVDLADRALQGRAFKHAVELKFLAGRDPQAAVAEGLGQVVAGQILVRVQLAADDPDPNHELVGRLLAFFFQLLADVAIVLLIGPVKLEDGGGIFAEMRGTVIHLVGHIGLQILAGQLDRFDLARLGAATRFGRLHLGPSLLVTTNVGSGLGVMITGIRRRPPIIELEPARARLAR